MIAPLLPLFVALPLAAAFLGPILARRWPGAARNLALGAASLGFMLATAVSPLNAPDKILVYRLGGWPPPLGINLVVDAFSGLLLFIIGLVTFLILLYALDYMRQYRETSRFYSLFMLLLAGMNGIVISGDLFNMFVFLEIGSIASYALVGYGTQHEELEASFKYLVMGSLASSCVLLGIALLYGRTGTLNLADLAARLGAEMPGDAGLQGLVGLAFALFLAGYGLKASLVPFHAWLPDAHPSAPAPISAMLSGLLIKSLGVYALCRLCFTVLGLAPGPGTPGGGILLALMALGFLSMLVGVLLAVGQWDFKRLLAYHSISQMGYVMVGLGLGTPLGVAAGLFHLFNHSLFKSCLFLCSGSLETAAGSRNLKELGGLNQRLPVTGWSCVFASLSISGMPPFNGFFSKLLLLLAILYADFLPIELRAALAGLLLLVSFLTLVSFIKVQKHALFGGLPARLLQVTEAPGLMAVAVALLAALCLLTGLAAPWLFDQLIAPAAAALRQPAEYLRAVLP